jgi:GIY-YIG catalytic domain
MKINNAVLNLSSYTLLEAELNVLNRGLNFVPSHMRYSPALLASEFDRFERKLQLFNFFSTKGDCDDSFIDVDDIEQPFTPRSNWTPKRLNSHITAFCQQLHADAIKLLNKRPRPNLSLPEIKALKQLRLRKDIIIKPADKGGGICIMDTLDYQTKVATMLNDTTVYIPVDSSNHDQIKDHADQLLTLLHESGYITEKQLQFLTDFTPRCPIFYGLPKIHKTNIPLRPIVSQIDAPTCMINALVDKLLLVAEKRIPDLFQDTTAFLNLIDTQKTIQPNSLLVTMDVVSLYTNIPHDEGIEFVTKFYDATIPFWEFYQPGLSPIPVEDLKILLRFILNNCTFQFADKFYRQRYGTTMGAKFSVKFANIYMHMWFETYLTTFHGPKFDYIGRLIDDIFTVWTHGRDALDNLIRYMNSCHQTIKFEANISTTKVHFLDTVVSIERDQLHTKVYSKPMAKKQFLFYSSCHPLHVKNAIPFSQAIRYRRNTDIDTQLDCELLTLKRQFRCRGYPNDVINNAFAKIYVLDRQQTLLYTTKADKRAKFKALLGDRSFLPLITTFHAQFDFDSLKQVLKKRWHEFIKSNKLIATSFAGQLPVVVFKRGQTIGNLLTSSTFHPPMPRLDNTLDILEELLAYTNDSNKIVRCGHPLCKCCDCLLETSTITSTDGHRSFAINDHLSCNSTNVIYVIRCSRCHKLYVGQTQRMLKDRLNNHRSDITLKKPTAIGLHFNFKGHSIADLQIIPVLQLLSTDKDINRAIENDWMKTLNTFYPFGLNHHPLATA